MFLPAEYAWFEPVLIASIVVFIIDLIGNSITFSNRYVSALVSAIVFAIVFGGLVYFGYGIAGLSCAAQNTASTAYFCAGAMELGVVFTDIDTLPYPK